MANKYFSYLWIMYLVPILCFNVYSQFSLENYRSDEIYLNFKTPAYALADTLINGKAYTVIKITNAPVTSEKGEPELPYLTQSIQIPNDAQMVVKVTDVQYKEISIKTIIPSKGNLHRSQNRDSIPFTFGSEYKKNSFYMDSIAYLSEPFILRDVRGVTISIYPFQYNPVTGILKIIESMKIKVYQSGRSDKNVLKRNSSNISSLFNDIYKRMFINYENSRYTPISDGEKMVVIVYPEYREAVEPLVEWKNQKGIKTSLYEYKAGSAGNSISSMKTFIQKMYDDSNITYFMLVGDYEQIPSPLKTYGNETVPTDPSLMKLNGADNYADAFIGRLSVQSISQAKNVVNKVLKYEKEPDSSGVWYRKAVGIASSEGNPSDISWMQSMRKVLLDYNYNRVDSVYQGKNPSEAKFTNYINAGRGWVNFMGHGSERGFGFKSGFWYTSVEVKTLTNENKLPVIISVACNNGDFKGYTCFAEEWLRRSVGGAIAFLGSAPLQDWTPPQHGQREMVRLLSIDRYISLGAIVYNGEAKMVEVKGAAADKTFNTWTLFGDPSMMVFTDTPQELSVTAPSVINAEDVEVNVDFGDAIDGRVALYSPESGIISSKIVRNSSSVTLPISNINVDKVLLTVTGRNKMPFSQYILIDGAVNIKNTMKQASIAPKVSFVSPLKLKVAAPDEDFYKISIFSLNGKSLYSENIKIKNGFAIIDLTKKGLSQSVYMVSIENSLHKIKERIFIK